jgi:hypothetical protein
MPLHCSGGACAHYFSQITCSVANPTLLSNKSQEDHQISSSSSRCHRKETGPLGRHYLPSAFLLHQHRKEGLWSGLAPKSQDPTVPRRREDCDSSMSTSRRTLGGTRARGCCGHCHRAPGAHPPAARGRGSGGPRGCRLLTVLARSGGAPCRGAPCTQRPSRRTLPAAPRRVQPRCPRRRCAIKPGPHAATPSPCKSDQTPDTRNTHTGSLH